MENIGESLIPFGSQFQFKTINILLNDKKFLDQISDMLEAKYYDSDSNKWIIDIIKDYYSKFKKSPTLHVFKLECDKIKDGVLKASVVNNLEKIYKFFNNPVDKDYIKEKFLEFCKNQTIKQAILKSSDLLLEGKYEKIKEMMNNALLAGEERNIGVLWNDENSLERRVSETLREQIETPFPVINEIMDGGLGKKELGIIVGPPGSGKSWILNAISVHAAELGKNVIHYTLELSDDYVGLRADSKITGYSPKDIKYHVDEVKKKIGKISGKIWLKEYPNKSVGVETLKSNFITARNFGINIDLVVVDYGDILKGNIIYQDAQKRLEVQNIYEELRGMAQELEIPIWTASQGNRSAEDEDVVRGKHISEDYSKVMIGDFLMSLSRKDNDRLAHTARFFIIKNRFGPDRLTFPAKMNTTNGSIEIYEALSDDGKKTKDKMKDDVYERKFLGSVYEDFDELG